MSRMLHTVVLIAVLSPFVFLAKEGDASSSNAAHKDVKPIVDPYQAVTGLKIRNIIRVLTKHRRADQFAHDKYPEKAFKCKVLYISKYHLFYVLVVQTRSLLCISEEIFNVSEIYYSQLYMGSWDLGEDIREADGSGCSRFIMIKEDAKEIIYNCIVDGKDFTVPKK